jgi:hypothetical protein
MKKIMSLTFLALFISMGAMAQNYGFGIKAGFNVSNFQTDGDHFRARLGYLAGIYANIKIAERVGFQPELIYSVQGAASDIENGVGVTLDYITLPMMFKVYLFPALNIQAGPYLGTVVRKQFRHSLANFDEDGMRDSFEGYDFGLQGGINVESRHGFNVGLRYVLGFADINRNYQPVGNGPLHFNSDLRNQLITFALGYTF